METVLIIITMGIVNAFCFAWGAKVGQTVSKGEPVKMPSVNPVEAIREHNAKKEAEHQQDIFSTIMDNIDNYDGTSNGQKDVPRG